MNQIYKFHVITEFTNFARNVLSCFCFAPQSKKSVGNSSLDTINPKQIVTQKIPPNNPQLIKSNRK